VRRLRYRLGQRRVPCGPLDWTRLIKQQFLPVCLRGCRYKGPWHYHRESSFQPCGRLNKNLLEWRMFSLSLIIVFFFAFSLCICVVYVFINISGLTLFSMHSLPSVPTCTEKLNQGSLNFKSNFENLFVLYCPFLDCVLFWGPRRLLTHHFNKRGEHCTS